MEQKIVIYVKSDTKQDALDLANRISIDKKDLNITKNVCWHSINNVLEINLDITEIEKPIEFIAPLEKVHPPKVGGMGDESPIL